MWQSTRPASLLPASLTVWPNWVRALARDSATLSVLSTQVQNPVGLLVPGHYIGGASAGLDKAQRIDSSLTADWLPCFWPDENGGLTDRGVWCHSGREVQYIPRNMHTVFALLCFVVAIHWLIFPYPSGLLHWHCGNLTIAPVPEKQPWWIWINTSCEFIMNDCITTTKQSTTKPCAYFLGYTVCDTPVGQLASRQRVWPFVVGAGMLYYHLDQWWARLAMHICGTKAKRVDFIAQKA